MFYALRPAWPYLWRYRRGLAVGLVTILLMELVAVGLPLLSVNALHHTTDDLQAAEHPFQLPKRDITVLNLDFKQQGVGGDDSWGAWPHEQFLIPCREQTYSFRLRPFNSREDIAKLARTELASPATSPGSGSD